VNRTLIAATLVALVTAGCEVQQADVTQLPFPDGRFARVRPALGGLIVRFAARRTEEAFGESS
jgi:hypothetical protein